MAEDWSFTEGKRFRERVVRQAILLGFQAEQYEAGETNEACLSG